MEILNFICYGCLLVIAVIVFLVLLITFGTSVYSCFVKKIEGKLHIKIVVSILIGCVCPWILKLIIVILKYMGV